MKINVFLKRNLRLYNTMSRLEEAFKPLNSNYVGLYTCGPTVYSRAHIGNFRAYLFADILKRTLLKSGYNVKHVMNITDVGELSGGDDGQDKMLLGARKENTTAWQVAKKYTDLFTKDRVRLKILPPTITCNATDHIKAQIALVKKLEEKGYTYQTADGIYFDTSQLNDYGRLAKLDIQGLEAGVRVEMGQKRNKTDFALWKFSNPSEQRDMEWESPWGIGFPGWHIECSAMSMKYLGEQFDIHTGGVDHIPVHHTNEIAQSETVTGKKPFVKYWMHLNFLKFEEDKMSKSLGNIKDLDQLEVDGISPMDFRYLCLTAKYRQLLNANAEAFKSAHTAYDNLVIKIKDIRSQIKTSKIKTDNKDKSLVTKYSNDFYSAIANDLNTPVALSILWSLIKDNKLSPQDKIQLIYDFDDLLGLDLEKITQRRDEGIPEEITKLVEERQKYKLQKNWTQADDLRNEIEDKGFVIEDVKDGYIIKPVRNN